MRGWKRRRTSLGEGDTRRVGRLDVEGGAVAQKAQVVADLRVGTSRPRGWVWGTMFSTRMRILQAPRTLASALPPWSHRRSPQLVRFAALRQQHECGGWRNPNMSLFKHQLNYELERQCKSRV
eukprot:61815-Pleurochrysis_carterae.AAC.1